MGAFLQNILQLSLSPQKGWEDISLSEISADRLRSRSVYPLMALAAFTAPLQLLYHHDLSVVDVILRGIAILVSLLAGYFISVYCDDVFMGKYVGEIQHKQNSKVVLCYAYGMLAMSAVLCNLLPVAVGLPVILPVCIGLIVWKSEAFLGVEPAQDMKFSLYVFLAIILPSLLLRFILGLIIGDWHTESTALL